MIFSPIAYEQLNARQKENYNFHKVAALLADFGFTSVRLSDDFEGADFVALHIDGETMLRVQLKSRMTIDRKYIGKGLHIAFLHGPRVFLYPHDVMVESLLSQTSIGATQSWLEAGTYTWPKLSATVMAHLDEYEV
jgi:hypothetical protein